MSFLSIPHRPRGLAPQKETLIMNKKISWRDVLDCKKNTYAQIGDMAFAAVDHGYRYFVWAGRVYQCFDNVGEEYKDTGIKADDLR